MLVDGKKGQVVALGQNVFSAVAVVDVKIEHRHPLGPGGLGLERCDSHRAEVAESHGPFLGRVMSGRAKQAEVGFAGLGQLERL